MSIVIAIIGTIALALFALATITGYTARLHTLLSLKHKAQDEENFAELEAIQSSIASTHTVRLTLLAAIGYLLYLLWATV